MAEITLTIPDAVKDRVLNALASQWGYAEEIADVNDPPNMIPNPQTKVAFVKEYLVRFLKQAVRNQEGGTAGRVAQDAAVASVDSEIAIS